MADKQRIVLLVAFSVAFGLIQSIDGLYDFPSTTLSIPKRDKDLLKNIDDARIQTYVQLGSESIDKQIVLEENLMNSQITIKNGSLSHVQLLETLPNQKTQQDSEVALKIVKSGQYILNGGCLPVNVNPTNCEEYFSQKELPDSNLRDECMNIINDQREGHQAFRRLLPSNYKDGFYKMYSELHVPRPRQVSTGLHNQSSSIFNGNYVGDDNNRSLALVQLAQFIEHDLSKTVSTTMKNGLPIDCCDTNNNKLIPRYVHPACAPLNAADPRNAYGVETCLNYVRSALAVGSNCNFGAAEQLNQATGYFDLSQLYGYTTNAQHRMRTFRNGQLKSTSVKNSQVGLLPMADENSHSFCAVKLNANENCFMAGDSRVNSNPFSIIIYTIFMRSHNQIAANLKQQYLNWDDEQLYRVAKKINIGIYRQIIYKEWLPAVLGDPIANSINTEHLPGIVQSKRDIEQYQVSNEFAIAAVRFYISMLPNVLHQFPTSASRNGINANSNNYIQPINLFLLTDQMYKTTDLLSNSNKIDVIEESIINQCAMKMDASYADSLLDHYMGTAKPTRADILAFDIQRGRDHGLQGYVKYLEICEGVSVNGWSDLEKYINTVEINKLRTLYKNVADIDLIVGGISEIPVNGSTVGPTFSCILGEQFSKIRQWQHKLDAAEPQSEASEIAASYKNWNAAKLICENTGIHEIPRNVFKITSPENPPVPCSMLLNSQS